MQWVGGHTKEADDNRKMFWHRWFAWYPVTVRVLSSGRRVVAWLEYVERKGTLYGKSWTWERRAITHERGFPVAGGAGGIIGAAVGAALKFINHI